MFLSANDPSERERELLKSFFAEIILSGANGRNLCRAALADMAFGPPPVDGSMRSEVTIPGDRL